MLTVNGGIDDATIGRRQWCGNRFWLTFCSVLCQHIRKLSSPLQSIGAFDLFKRALGDLGHWIFATYSPSFIDGSAMEEMAGMAHGYSDAGYPEELLRMSFVLPAPQALLLLGLAAVVMRTKRL